MSGSVTELGKLYQELTQQFAKQPADLKKLGSLLAKLKVVV